MTACHDGIVYGAHTESNPPTSPIKIRQSVAVKGAADKLTTRSMPKAPARPDAMRFMPPQEAKHRAAVILALRAADARNHKMFQSTNAGCS